MFKKMCFDVKNQAIENLIYRELELRGYKKLVQNWGTKYILTKETGEYGCFDDSVSIPSDYISVSIRDFIFEPILVSRNNIHSLSKEAYRYDFFLRKGCAEISVDVCFKKVVRKEIYDRDVVEGSELHAYLIMEKEYGIFEMNFNNINSEYNLFAKRRVENDQ